MIFFMFGSRFSYHLYGTGGGQAPRSQSSCQQASERAKCFLLFSSFDREAVLDIGLVNTLGEYGDLVGFPLSFLLVTIT